MSFPLSAAKIAAITGASLTNVVTTWAALQDALVNNGCYSDQVAIAAIATVRVECPGFRPINEFGSAAYFEKHYEGRVDLGNVAPGDGVLFHGRGLIQLTGRNNYRKYGALLGLELEDDPQLALQPATAAEIFALFFKEHGCCDAANAGNWTRVRELVNGGHNGLPLFLEIVQKLQAEMPATASG